MSWQYDSVAFNEGKDKMTATCYCGELGHGVVVIHFERQYPDFPDDPHECLMQLSACPYASWSAKGILGRWQRFVSRCRIAYAAFRLEPIDVDLSFTGKDAAKIGQWLIEQSEKKVEEKP